MEDAAAFRKCPLCTLKRKLGVVRHEFLSSCYSHITLPKRNNQKAKFSKLQIWRGNVGKK